MGVFDKTTRQPMDDPTVEPKKIVIVDDDPSVRRALKRLISSAGFQAEIFGTAEEFLEAGPPGDTAVFVLDIRLPGLNGLALQERLTSAGYRVPVIFITAHGDDQIHSLAMTAGAVAFLEKPVEEQVLLDAIHAALTKEPCQKFERNQWQR
jgi:FixJ family two-component response regulator